MIRYSTSRFDHTFDTNYSSEASGAQWSEHTGYCLASAHWWWLAASAAQAQLGAGGLSGNVVDQAGHSVPGACLTVTEIRTALTRTAITGTDGGYAVPALQPGTYRIRAESSGFH